MESKIETDPVEEKETKKRKGYNTIYKFYKAEIHLRDQFAQTPDDLIAQLEAEYGKFDFDPCPVNPQFDGLSVTWGKNNYVNPPFNNLKAWLEKAIHEWKLGGKQIVFLMPIRLHTKYFIDLIKPLLDESLVEVHILQGGLRFKNYANKTPFGLMLLIFPAIVYKSE